MKAEDGNHPVRSDGFTLIEIMIAVAIVAITFLSFYRLFSQAVAADGITRFYTVAPLLAQQKMSEICSGTAAGNDGSGIFENHPGYGWQVRVLDVSSETLGEAASDMKQVDITISLNESSRQFTLRAYEFLPE